MFRHVTCPADVRCHTGTAFFTDAPPDRRLEARDFISCYGAGGWELDYEVVLIDAAGTQLAAPAWVDCDAA